MPNIELKGTEVHTIPIVLRNPVDSSVEPVPAGDVFSAVSSSPAISATVGTMADGTTPAVVINALTLPSVNTMGQNVTVSDSAGDIAFIQGVDYPVPPQVGDITLDVASDVITTQPEPTAPGP